ncbi:tetratricopeptide repeat protein [Methylophaga sulfidovorans]|uniref:Tetratricopeptide repeat-containing protein n=1 Tax=Methylophaga sulfidovorans TaxID=45496 RepID=A0A1I4APJ7_9GAMM|nr:tetratricopeptide repeat protein [Methylophaga sulfidovorans]SFK57841.1 Tetratricopeptide repeat-containing protein [Methylophaga sulfidovorans]
MKQGDVIYGQVEEGQWSVIKLLDIDTNDDGGTFHCLFYELLDHQPTLDDRPSFKVMAWHAPINCEEIRKKWTVLCSEDVQPDELEGFHEYLKHTDFPRYLSITGQNAEDVVKQANAYYQQGLTLTDQGKTDEAIQCYTKAIAIFPLFYEAVDNRAYVYMDKGDDENALAGFQQSLQINPHGMHALFSYGECLLKLKRYEEAEHVFQTFLNKFSEHKSAAQRFLKQAQTYTGNKTA